MEFHEVLFEDKEVKRAIVSLFKSVLKDYQITKDMKKTIDVAITKGLKEAIEYVFEEADIFDEVNKLLKKKVSLMLKGFKEED